MSQLFAVMLERGPSYLHDRPLEGQVGWPEHAAFMDALADEGWVRLGGPLEGTREVLLIIRASDEQEIRARLAPDPWHRGGLLRIQRILPWTLRLGKLG